MTTAIKILWAILLVAVIFLVCFLIVILYQMRPTIESTARDAHVTILEIGLAAKNVREASGEWKKASSEAQAQAKAITQVELHADKAVTDLDAMILHTDKQVNDVLLPTANAALQRGDELLRSAGVATDRSLPAVDNLGKATASLSNLLDDSSVRSIRASVAHVDEATASLADTSKHADQIAANADEASRLALERFRQALKPASMAKTILYRLLGLAGPAAQVATAVK